MELIQVGPFESPRNISILGDNCDRLLPDSSSDDSPSDESKCFGGGGDFLGVSDRSRDEDFSCLLGEVLRRARVLSLEQPRSLDFLSIFFLSVGDLSSDLPTLRNVFVL